MRTVTILILALTASSVMSNCVGPNAFSALLTGATAYTPTLATGDITAANTAGTAATAAGAKCGYTATTTLICTTAEAKLIADIQSYITAQKTAMQTASGVRDQYIIEKRGDVIDVLSSLRRLNELADSNNDVTIPSTYLVFASAFIGYADEIASNFTSIVENFDDYQEARATCMDSLLQTQAAILCNVMVDDTITGITQTVNSEAVALSDTFLATLNTACFNYITYSVRQSSIILTAAYSKGIAKLVSGIEALANGDATTAATDLSSAFTTFGTVTFSSTASQVPAQTPSASGSACTSTSCAAWLEDLYSSTGVLDQTAAVRGGEAVSAFTWTSRVLSEGNERRLAATGFGPTLSSFSFTTGFEKNPANVDNTENANSALRNGIVAVAIAALALVF